MTSCDEIAPERRSFDISDDQLDQEHDVFLSFRGSDTRKEFASHLYHSLDNAGIRVFRDNDNLYVGEEIGPQLIQGIEHSKICIPILSKNYASSKWCLKEFTLMMKLREKSQLKVLPIFYDVSPDEVQHQSCKEFIDAFVKHESVHKAETVEAWRAALSEVGSLKGWEKEKMSNGDEAELIKAVVATVRKMLAEGHTFVKDTVVGLEKHIDAVMKLLEVGAPDVRIVGIWGMGGIGKTTLAKVVYNQISRQFDRCGFLENIREKSSQPNGVEFLQRVLVNQLSGEKRQDISTVSHGIKELQHQCRGKKVLIFLDDIDKKQQLHAFGVGAVWLRRGSRLIVTTRDSDVLDKLRDKMYEVKEMEHEKALQLFCKHAFKADSPPVELSTISQDMVKKAGGLPLALEVIGSDLAGKERKIWEAMLERLEKIPHKDIESKLMLSYKNLDDPQKYIYLSIACFFIGEDRRIAGYIWEDKFGCSPSRELDVLCSKSLVKIKNSNELWMHDHLRDLGRAIVEKENNDPAGKRAWLWRSANAKVQLQQCKALPRIEAIRIDWQGDGRYRLTDKQCQELPNLTFMELSNIKLKGNFQHCLSNLRWLSWTRASIKSINMLPLGNLVVLNLSRSRIGNDRIWSHKQVAPKLKSLNLSWCVELTTIPDFSLFPNLERLDLSYCEKLEVVDSSIGKLNSLIYLNLWGCQMLKELPHQMSALTSLGELDVSCLKIKDIPLSENMKKLEILRVAQCFELKRVPHCIGDMTSLRKLSFSYSDNLKELPASIWQLTSLVELNLAGARISTLPEAIGNLQNLEMLDISRSDIRCIPRGIWKLEKLRVINALVRASLEGEISTGIGRLSQLEVLKIKATDMYSLPTAIIGLSHLHTLQLCQPSREYFPLNAHDIIPRLESLPKLPVSLTSAVVTCKSMLPIPNLSHLTKLQELEFQSCVRMIEIPLDISKLTKLQELRIVECPLLVEIQGLGNLKMLRDLWVLNCKKLRKVGLGGLEALNTLVISQCAAINNLENLFKLKLLQRLDARYCEKLSNLDGLDGLEALEVLDISGSAATTRLPNLSNLKRLKYLAAGCCENLQELEGLDGLEALEYLNISYCKAIKTLPDLSSLNQLQTLRTEGCEKLQTSWRDWYLRMKIKIR